MDSQQYGVTDDEKLYADRIQARHIVQEIINFGITQEQIVRIIQLLSLELENNDLMNRIIESTRVTNNDDEVANTKLIL